MDKQTVEIYTQEAAKIAQIHATMVPIGVYRLIAKFFVKRGFTADIGCGIGRDSFYLHQQGFPVVGVDASLGMLQQAKQHYPEINFIQDCLPQLAGLKNNQFQNILCSAVLMHLPNNEINLSCYRLLELLTKNGRLIISFRNSQTENQRENGKLYQTISLENLIGFFKKSNGIVLHNEIDVEIKRKLNWVNLVVEKN